MDVAFRVRCPRETELGATLRRVGRSMIAQRLRPVEGEGASIPVSCSVEDGRVVFRVEVPDDAQAGWYTSCVVEEHGNTTCGTLSLRIFED